MEKIKPVGSLRTVCLKLKICQNFQTFLPPSDYQVSDARKKLQKFSFEAIFPKYKPVAPEFNCWIQVDFLGKMGD